VGASPRGPIHRKARPAAPENAGGRTGAVNLERAMIAPGPVPAGAMKTPESGLLVRFAALQQQHGCSAGAAMKNAPRGAVLWREAGWGAGRAFSLR
jgi:hypothetical protein